MAAASELRWDPSTCSFAASWVWRSCRARFSAGSYAPSWRRHRRPPARRGLPGEPVPHRAQPGHAHRRIGPIPRFQALAQAVPHGRPEARRRLPCGARRRRAQAEHRTDLAGVAAARAASMPFELVKKPALAVIEMLALLGPERCVTTSDAALDPDASGLGLFATRSARPDGGPSLQQPRPDLGLGRAARIAPAEGFVARSVQRRDV